MSPKTFIIVIGAPLLIGGGIIAWLLLSVPSGTPSAPEPTPSGGSVGGSNQSSVTVQPNLSSSSGTQILPDLQSEYATLMQKLLAEKAIFTPTDSTSGDRGSVYALYAADIAAEKKAYPKLTRFPISISLTDLTDDGVAEALVQEDLPGYCGTGGCPLDIYKKTNGKWALLFTGLASGDVGLGNVITNGYRDLYLQVSGDTAYQSKVMHYVWDGKKYFPKEVVAVWDGSTFITP